MTDFQALPLAEDFIADIGDQFECPSCAQDALLSLTTLLQQAYEQGAREALLWRPIDTAPRDGSWVVVASTWNRYARRAVQYSGEFEAFVDEYENVIKNLSDEGYTHWMSLPPCP